MIQVRTRGGVFGPGGYGGGIFDGAEAGFGGMGSFEQAGAGIAGMGASPSQLLSLHGLGVFPPPSKFPNGYPTPTYTTKAGETGSTIAKDITGSASNWTKLANANPSTKCATYGMCFKAGAVLTLPADWVTSAGGGATTPSGSLPADDLAFLIDVVNNMLFDLGYQPIPADTRVLNSAVCGAVDFVSKQVQSGSKKLQAADVADFMDLAKQYAPIIGAICQPMAPWGAPQPSATPAPSPAPAPAGTNPFVAIWKAQGLDLGAETARLGHDPCLVRPTDVSSAVVAEMQRTMNDLLSKKGYKPIAVTGAWDGQTCGALFALRGAWDPQITLCQIAGRDDIGGWQVPAGCKTGVAPIEPTPVKPDEDGGGKSSTTMAWMMGGLVGAAVLAGLYAAKKRR